MKVIDFGKGFSGMMNGMVYYEMNGKLYARNAPRKRTQQEKENTSATVKGINRRFRAIQQLYSIYRRKVSPDIWRLAAREEGKMAHNLFHSTNCGCLNAEGKMAAPELFQFTAGTLLLPREMAVEALGGGQFRATWTDERELATAAANDRLKVGVFYPSTPTGLYWAEEMSGTRGDGCGEFRLDTQSDTEAHVYLFFAREDGGAYTPSMHFHVAMDKE